MACHPEQPFTSAQEERIREIVAAPHDQIAFQLPQLISVSAIVTQEVVRPLREFDQKCGRLLEPIGSEPATPQPKFR